jgi:hypothetical protein
VLLHVLAGDSNGDAVVGFPDLFDVQNAFNATGVVFGPGDLDGDGTVGFDDVTILQTTFNNSLTAPAMDYGDAPESGTSFPTTLPDGARHVLGSDLRLGASVDGEANGQPDTTGTGDGADEDGVTFGTLQAGNASADVTVTANVPSGTAMLNAWIDFNADGDWGDPGEQVFVDQALSNGSNSLPISIPAGATAGSTFARFRITSTPGYSFFGLAADGEVEDYQVTIVAALGGASSQQLVSAGWFVDQATAKPQPEGLRSEQQNTKPEVQPTWSSLDPEVIDLAIEQVAASGHRTPRVSEKLDALDEQLIDHLLEQGDLLEDSVL